jgi:hypothetical protein
MNTRVNDPQLVLVQDEVTYITGLLRQAAELLTREDGCCYQIFPWTLEPDCSRHLPADPATLRP